MFRIRIITVCLALVLGVAAPGLQAQESATVQALATVISALTVTGTNDLDFGNVTPGTPETVAKTDVGTAGEWSITGPSAAEVQITFTLPDSLHSATAAMPITFLGTDGSYEDGTGGGQAAPAGNLNPLNTNLVDLSAIDGSMTVWIGGQTIPSVGQSGGNYSADVEIIVTLTGN
ncbi:MAG: hypothetical protein KOO62_05585 [candidate division Zixibacteria bacterium]|nr:hypothetical protein [candidate division Zixibacteria bacterium]